MFWHKWLKAFEHYLEALGENELVDSSKCVLLQNCLGPEGQRIFTTLIQGETTYAVAVSALTGFFNSDLTSQMHRLKFHQRAQMPGETVDQFVTTLEELLKPCNCGDLQDKLILDQLIEKTNSPQLKERLLLERETLTLAAALVISKEVESALNESELFGFHEVSVDIGDDLDPPVQRKAKRGRPRRGEKRTKAKPHLTKTPINDGSNDDNDEDFVISPSKLKGPHCPICTERRFRDAHKLARHMRTHTKEKPFSCPVCTTTFSQSYHMTRHMRNQHGTSMAWASTSASKCGKNLSSWLELKAHKKTHAVEGLTCLSCDKQFKEKAALVSHLKLHKKVQSSPRSLICGDCGKVFGRMYHLKRHIVTHRKATNGECYTCPDCQKNFAFPEDLNKHLEIHVKENNGTCPKCNETFSSPEELETHMGVHEKSYTCNTCGKKFKVEYALKKHEQGHQNDQYYCSLCRKRFIKLSHYKRHIMLTALKYHLRTHTEERPYQCSCCIETFEEKEDLEQHCLKHRKFKKERPYSCTRCDCAFSTLMELTDHMSSHEGEQPLNCPVILLRNVPLIDGGQKHANPLIISVQYKHSLSSVSTSFKPGLSSLSLHHCLMQKLCIRV
uniref:C2H2-type domain-containing protein n=1 Tax=Lates calcarifer TaxID=8187 RepID=A0A4W6FXB4_LATCA